MKIRIKLSHVVAIHLATTVAMLAAMWMTAAATAQNLEIPVPVGQQTQEKWSMDRPATGMSREQVRSFFGEPVSTKSPVGDPPISSWEYEDFVVYFEYDHVIHSVLKFDRRSQSESSTATVEPLNDDG